MSEIVDRPEESRLVFEEGGSVAELVYELDGSRLIIVHTGVPDELGGRGLGGKLVAAAVERARRDERTVVPWCPFARRWIREHEDAAARLTIDWTAPPS